MIKAIAIDDEPLALEVLSIYCESLPNITLEKTFTSTEKAKEYINQHHLDVIFLDIEMPNINGINFYNSLNKNIKVVFATAYHQYAVEGFNLNAVDYILKPISLERFTETVARIEQILKWENNKETQNDYLFIRADYRLYQVPFQAILYVEAMDDYVKIFQQDEKTITARSTMKAMLEMLPEKQFVRIHRSYIIPVQAIKSIGTQKVDLGYKTFPIGNSYRKNLNLFL